MFQSITRSISQSVVQDLATAGSAWLATHGYLASNQTDSFVGSVCFLAMLAVNAWLQHQQSNPKE